MASINTRAVILAFAVLSLCIHANTVSAQGDISAKESMETSRMIAEGEKAIENGDFDTAYTVFNNLLRKYPGSEKLNFVLGLTCFARGDYSRARLAFDRTLQINPVNDRARLELAKVYFTTGEFGLARNEFMVVLNHNPPENVKSNIQYYLDVIRKGIKRWGFSCQIAAGGFRDNNANLGPDSDIVSITPIVSPIGILTEMTTQDPVETDGTFGSISLTQTYDAGAPKNWILVGTESYYQNWVGSQNNYENMFAQFTLGPRRLTARTSLHLPVTIGHITSGHEQLVNMYGINPTYLRIYGKSGETECLSAIRIESRDYKEFDDRDGIYMALNESVTRTIGRTGLSVSLIASLFNDRTEEKIYQYSGGSLGTGVDLKLQSNARIYGRAKYTKTTYAEKELLALEKREDDQWQFTAGTTMLVGAQFGLDLNHQVTDNRSTFGLYQYDRNVTTLSAFFMF